MELTDSVKSLLIETTKSLKGSARRMFYVDILDQFCGMLERADRVIIGG